MMCWYYTVYLNYVAYEILTRWWGRRCVQVFWECYLGGCFDDCMGLDGRKKKEELDEKLISGILDIA